MVLLLSLDDVDLLHAFEGKRNGRIIGWSDLKWDKSQTSANRLINIDFAEKTADQFAQTADTTKGRVFCPYSRLSCSNGLGQDF